MTLQISYFFVKLSTLPINNSNIQCFLRYNVKTLPVYVTIFTSYNIIWSLKPNILGHGFNYIFSLNFKRTLNLDVIAI